MKLICAQIVSYLSENSIDYEKIAKLAGEMDESDIKGSIAALVFIFSGGAKYDVEESILSNELQQLGLPKEHCDALGRPYRENLPKIREKFLSDVFHFPRLSSFDWRVDYVISTSSLKDCNTPTVSMKFEVQDPLKATPTESSFEVSAEKFRVLFAELSQAKAIMDTLWDVFSK